MIAMLSEICETEISNGSLWRHKLGTERSQRTHDEDEVWSLRTHTAWQARPLPTTADAADASRMSQWMPLE